MDDISSMINSVLSDPESMKKIQEIAGGLGLGDKTEKEAPTVDAETLGAITRAAEVLSQKDDNIELLKALKCHFSPKRAKKVDDAIKIMSLLRLLPLLKDKGLGSLLGGR